MVHGLVWCGVVNKNRIVNDKNEKKKTEGTKTEQAKAQMNSNKKKEKKSVKQNATTVCTGKNNWQL